MNNKMRFVSKNANLMVVLKPGLPGNHLTGQNPVTGIYVKFQNGIVDVKDEKMIEQMKNHPGYNLDYISVEDSEVDPYAGERTDLEPAHNIKEIQFGHIVGSKKTNTPVKLPPEMKKFIEAEAIKMAKAMLPDMMKEVFSQMKNPSSEVEAEVNDENTETNVMIEEKPKSKSKKAKIA